LVLRLWPVICHGAHPTLFLDSDSWGYQRLACNLLAGHGYSWEQQPPYLPNLYRPPGLPVLLLALYQLTGVSVCAAIVLQAIVAAATVAVTFVLVRDMTGRPSVAFGSAAILAIDPVGIVYSSLLLTEVYTAFIVVLTALCLLRYSHYARPGWLLAAAGLLASGILVHPVLLFAPFCLPAVPLLTAHSSRQYAVGSRQYFLPIAYCILLTVLALSPAAAWIIRNRHVGDFTGISSVTAVNMLKYKAAGVEAELRGTTRAAERDRLTRECEALLPPDATPGERFRLWQRRGAEILLAHPLTYAWIHLKGMVVELFGPDRDLMTRLLYGTRLLDADERYSDATIAAARAEQPMPALELARLLILALQGLLILSFLYGTWHLARERQWGLLLSLLGMPAYVLLLSGGPEAAPRFRVIYLPMLATISAFGVRAAWVVLRSAWRDQFTRHALRATHPIP
jgi:hypothetical protein